MLKDWNHDLVHELSEISDSLWRMDLYSKAARGCKDCSALWEKLRADYEEQVKLLTQEIGRHVSENRFD